MKNYRSPKIRGRNETSGWQIFLVGYENYGTLSLCHHRVLTVFLISELWGLRQVFQLNAKSLLFGCLTHWKVDHPSVRFLMKTFLLFWGTFLWFGWLSCLKKLPKTFYFFLQNLCFKCMITLHYFYLKFSQFLITLIWKLHFFPLKIHFFLKN